MRLGRGVVGITGRGTVFAERPILDKKAMEHAVRLVGRYTGVEVVGKIKALFVDNPKYPLGCSPNYGVSDRYETSLHCILNGDICRIREEVRMSDGSTTAVANYVKYRACSSWVCWVFARFINKFGWIRESCIEEYDNAMLYKGNEKSFPDLILFAGSEDGRLALFTPGIHGNVSPPPFDVEVQSVDYQEGGVIRQWRTTINGVGLFLVWFGDYVLPFRSFYSYPTSVTVRPGFSGSNAFIVG